MAERSIVPLQDCMGGDVVDEPLHECAFCGYTWHRRCCNRGLAFWKEDDLRRPVPVVGPALRNLPVVFEECRINTRAALVACYVTFDLD